LAWLKKGAQRKNTMDTRRTVLIGITLVLATLVAACAAAEEDGPPAEDPPPAQGTALSGTRWVLISLKGEALIEGKEITLRFGPGAVGGAAIEGSGGCNTYGGIYTASGESLTLSEMYWTEIGCVEPKGIMEQEQAFFQALSTAATYRIARDAGAGDRLELYDEGETRVLVFAAEGTVAASTPTAATSSTTTKVAAATPTPVPSTATATAVPATATLEPPTPTPAPPEPPPGVEPPAGFTLYVEPSSGISLWLPERWTATEPVREPPHGQSRTTILQSYPPGKYVGGERRQPGDTKCDLIVHWPGTSVADVVPRNRSDPPVTVLSEEEIVLRSGLLGKLFEVESMGRSVSLVAEINGRAVVLVCFGELEPFDEIAATLHAAEGFEVAPLPTVEPVAAIKRYRDSETGVSVLVPGEWVVTGIVPGQRVTLQSYPESKYVGGEALQAGDTKCDLSILPPDASVAGFVQQMKADSAVSLLSEAEIVLASGEPGTRIKLESMGRSLLLVTALRAATGDERVVVLVCFGELEPFDEIAATLHAADEASALIAALEMPASLPSGAAVTVMFTLINDSSEELYVLKWFTPLEGLAGDIFRVQREGVELEYRGKLVKRAAPTSDDYVRIGARGSVSIVVDLVQGYDFSQAGQYTVQYRSPRLSHTAKTPGDQAGSLDELGMVQIPSNPVRVTIGRP
jgi:heat shock protein HslJ